MRLVHMILVTILLGMTSASMGCIGDRGPKITYHNKTDSAIWINLDIVTKTFSGHYELNPRIHNDGPIEAGKSTSFVYFSIPLGARAGEHVGNYVITALTAEDTIVFQRLFTWTELYDSRWTVIIVPTAKGTEQSDNVTGK